MENRWNAMSSYEHSHDFVIITHLRKQYVPGPFPPSNGPGNEANDVRVSEPGSRVELPALSTKLYGCTENEQL